MTQREQGQGKSHCFSYNCDYQKSGEWPKVCFSLLAETEYLAGKTSGLRPNTKAETESTNTVDSGNSELGFVTNFVY